MGIFHPRLQGQQAATVLEGLFVIASRFRRCGEVAKGVDKLEVEMFLGDAPPFLKWIVVGHGKAGKKIAVGKFGCLAQTVKARLASVNLCMRMGGTRGHQPGKDSSIHLNRRSGIELHGVARDQQPGGIGSGIVKQLAEAVQGLAQAVVGALGAVAGP